MAKRRKAFVHIGLDDGHGDVIERAIAKHAHALPELGVKGPARTREEMFRATVDLLGTHDEWGYRRADVDGAWSELGRRAAKGKDTVVLSQPLLASAGRRQAAQVVAGLSGFEVHVVATTHAPDDPAQDLLSVLDRWSDAVKGPEQIHVVVASDRTETWRSFGRVVGFGTASLGVDDLPAPLRPVLQVCGADVLQRLGASWAEALLASEYDLVGDPEDLVPREQEPRPVRSAELLLSEALREVDKLSRRNESLQLRLETMEKKRAKLKRRLSEVA